jgi:signal transduction histidine kinase
VFLNLIANAIDAMRDDEDHARHLRVRAGAGEGNSVSIAVEDSGPGIAAGDRERIFDAFFTTKASGMGLGLAICRSIVEAHGGRLAVAAATPRGTIFEITLPTGEAGER